jgi:hypothetical protein
MYSEEVMEPQAETVARVGWVRLPLDVRLSPAKRQRLHLRLETPAFGTGGL